MIDGSAAASGGAISNAGNLTVTNSTLADNVALAGSGAGIYNTGSLVVTDSSFSKNAADYYGGAIYNDGGTTIHLRTRPSSGIRPSTDWAAPSITRAAR